VRAPSDLVWFLHKHGVDFRAAPASAAGALLPLLFPLLWLGALYSMMRRQMGGQGNVSKRASAQLLSADGLSFEDVAGIDAAKEEVREVVAMLKSPATYAAAGARLPSGVLMCGPPGTGKTLLARVMAAQAGVPFFYCSGSDFVELFVGRGAARMRALFKEAAAVSPCIVFVDELDARSGRRVLVPQLAPERHGLRCLHTHSAVFTVLLSVVFTRCSEDAAQYRPPALMLAYSARRSSTRSASSGRCASRGLTTRCSREAAERQPRGSREAAERQPRGSREAAERQPRGSREVAERQPRGSREAAERQPRGGRERAEREPYEVAVSRLGVAPPRPRR